MKSPITYSEREKKYIIWVSYWGTEVIKYFSTPEKAAEYISRNPQKCIEIKTPATQAQIDFWISELRAAPKAEHPDSMLKKAEVGNKKKPTKIWLWLLIFIMVFIINLVNNHENAIVTLISSITQVLIVLALVGIFLGIKKLFKKDK